MKTTLKTSILQFFLGRPDWLYGGVIEDAMREETGAKGGTTSRELRRMEKSGILLKQIVPFDGKRVVQYKLATPQSENQASLFEEDKGVEAGRSVLDMGSDP